MVRTIGHNYNCDVAHIFVVLLVHFHANSVIASKYYKILHKLHLYLYLKIDMHDRILHIKMICF